MENTENEIVILLNKNQRDLIKDLDIGFIEKIKLHKIYMQLSASKPDELVSAEIIIGIKETNN